jgi:hypothetical protein
MDTSEVVESRTKESLNKIKKEFIKFKDYLLHENFPIEKKPEYFL